MRNFLTSAAVGGLWNVKLFGTGSDFIDLNKCSATQKGGGRLVTFTALPEMAGWCLDL